MEKRIDKIARNDKGKKRRRPLTKEDRENGFNRLEKKIETYKQFHLPPLSGKKEFSSKREVFSEKEIRQQEKDLDNESLIPTCTHREIMEDTNGLIVCRYCGITIKIIKKKRIIRNLLCNHRNTIKKDEFEVCIRCGGKWKI